jgi:MbtH protein
VNHYEAGYFIWPAERENPPGWRDASPVRASARECLALIGDLDTERRPAEAVNGTQQQAKYYAQALGA